MQSEQRRLQHGVRRSANDKCEGGGCRCHLNALSEPVDRRQRKWKIVGKFLSYCSPMRLHVSSAICIDCLEPLTDGEPLHDAAKGISWGSRRVQLVNWKGQRTGIGGHSIGFGT